MTSCSYKTLNRTIIHASDNYSVLLGGGGNKIDQDAYWQANPLTPKSDQHLISPYNISPESHTKVMRIKEMIKNNISSDL